MSCAWRRRSGRRCPGRCAANWTGAASTRGRAPRGTPRPRSYRQRSGWSRTRRRKARRGCPASWRRGAWAPTRRCWRRSCASARRTRASTVTRRGLRLDQAAAVWHVLTSARTVEVVTGPAGTGKTRVQAAAARAWGGPVFGTATSQNATNELRNAGVRVAANTTRLLADLRQHPAGLADHGRRRLDGVHGPSGRAGGVRGAERLQAGAGRGPGTARRRGRRRRDDAAGGPARLRAAGRAGPVRRRLGTRGLAAAAPRGRHRAG